MKSIFLVLSITAVLHASNPTAPDNSERSTDLNPKHAEERIAALAEEQVYWKLASQSPAHRFSRVRPYWHEVRVQEARESDHPQAIPFQILELPGSAKLELNATGEIVRVLAEGCYRKDSDRIYLTDSETGRSVPPSSHPLLTGHPAIAKASDPDPCKNSRLHQE